MPIVSSSYTIDSHEQRDGSRYVRESMTDNTGRVHEMQYQLPAGQGATEAQAFLAQHVAALDVMLAEAEAESLIGN